MKERYYDSENSRCGACGENLGRNRVWEVVFSDDPAEVVARVLSGEINWVRCPHCGFDGGWLWPNVFLYVVVEEERAVCVTLIKPAAHQLSLLREAFDGDDIQQRGLDPDRLLKRTKIIYDYKGIAEALKIPVEQIEQEMEAILRYLERSGLSGRERIEHLIQGAIDTGAISLEAQENTDEFLEEIEKYRSTLTGTEDERVPQVLEQLSRYLSSQLEHTRKRLPRRDETSALAEAFNSSRAPTQKDLLNSFFESSLQEATAGVLQLRLIRLCDLQSRGLLKPRAAAPIDLRPELTKLVEELLAGQNTESSILSERDLRLLPEVKKFLGSLTGEMVPQHLREAESSNGDAPPPAWFHEASQVLNQIYSALQDGPASMSLLDPIADKPLAKAYVFAEIGREMTNRGEMSGAMLHLSNSLDLVQGVLQSSGVSPDYWTGRLYAVCLERMARLQLQFGRLEDAVKMLRGARSMYEEVGASDGVLASLREEATIWLDLDQPERAEEMFSRVVSASEGLGRANEVRDLMNLANVYRRLNPWLEAEMGLTIGQGEESQQQTPEEPEQEEEEKEGKVEPSETPFERKGGIGLSLSVEGHDELKNRYIIESEQLRLLYRALAVAKINGDADYERMVMGRLVAVYGEQGCTELASEIFDRLMENSTLENVGLDAQFFALNRLRRLGGSQEDAGDHERARATRAEELQLVEFILAQETNALSPLVIDELLGDKACLLEGLEEAEEARRYYRDTIERLERSRLWMRDPENKRGLQSRRWRPYVRGARNSLRMYLKDQSRTELLNEAWYYIQAGRSRALLDIIAQDETSAPDEAGVASVRPAEFKEVSARLAKDLAVLEYVLMPSSPGCPGHWTMFVIEPGADKPWLAWREPDMERVLEAKEKLTDLADEFEATIIQYGFKAITKELEQRYISALETLADILLPAGLLEELRARGYRRLVIVADAYLLELPFAALRPMQAGERVYLGLPNERGGFQLIYAPSSSIFGRWAQRASTSNRAESQRAALFVDPLGDLSEFNPGVMQVFSAIESSLLDRHVEITRLDGKEATPDAWFNKGRGCNLVIYFGHSIAGPEQGEQATLTLSDGAGGVAPITAESIYSAATRALFSKRSLFIFASCSGGLVSAGRWDSDRELRGLSAAHLYAGCGAVIAASRPLVDSPTLVLLNTLVKEILAGHDAASSLTATQIKMAASTLQHAHPHFWGYVGLMGAPDWRFAG